MGSFDDLETCFGILWTVNTTCTSSKEVKKRIRNRLVQSQRWHVTYKAWDKATFIYYKEAGNQNFKLIKDWSELKRVYIVRKLFWSSLSSHSDNTFLGVVKVVDKGQCPLLTSEGTIFKAWFHGLAHVTGYTILVAASSFTQFWTNFPSSLLWWPQMVLAASTGIKSAVLNYRYFNFPWLFIKI